MNAADEFLQNYSSEVAIECNQFRRIVKEILPEIIEFIDVPAKMIAFAYGEKYTDMGCSLFPSKKGTKLSFYKGLNFSDEYKLLQGNGKITRYLAYAPTQLIDEK